MDDGRTDGLIHSAFDLLHLNGKDTSQLPLVWRTERLQRLFTKYLPALDDTPLRG
jgi:ATP-dependent DNA ligase